jgi:hypothetical protein
MGKSENHVYSIDLDLKTSQASKQALKEMQDAFNNSNESVDELNKTYKELADNTEDVLELNKQYNKVLEKSLSEKDKMIDKLKAEQVAVAASKDLTEDQKKAKLALLEASIKSIEVEKKILKSKTKEIQLETKMKDLVKADLQALKDKVKEQFKFIAALKTTEGRYNAIKKAASGVAKVGLKVGKGAALGAGGLFMGAMGMVMGAANQLAEKDRILQSLKGNIDPDVVDQVQISTNADYSTIVAAINRISDLKPKSTEQLIAGAIEEVWEPGMGRMLLLQNRIDNQSIEKMVAANAQIRKQTGAQNLTEAYSATERIRAVSNNNIGQIQAVQAYAALTQGGLSDESAIRIINDIAKKGGNFIENLNNADLSKYVKGQEKNLARNLQLGLSEIDTSKQPTKTKAQELAEKMRKIEAKKNEMIAEFIEKMPINTILNLVQSLLKLATNILPKALEVITAVIEKIAKYIDNIITAAANSHTVTGFFSELRKMREDELDSTLKAQEKQKREIKEKNDDLESRIKDRESKNAELRSTIASWDRAAKVAIEQVSKGKWYSPAPSNMSHISGYSSMSHYAQGGLVTSPSICGEAGPELVIPLDNSRAGRASQIINNYNTTQSFNMQSNQSTPLAFSQAIGQNRFIKRFAGV